MSKIYQKLLNIQAELKAPKTQYNSFGKYKYRSCEDILQAVKKLLIKYNVTLTLSDEVQFIAGEYYNNDTKKNTEERIGGRFYIKAIATLFDCESGDTVKVEAVAREEESKSGMTASQLSGSTSSFARKYALNGLFAIDDNKDVDGYNNGKPTDPKPETDPKLLSTQNSIVELCVQLGGQENKDLMTTLKKYTKNGNPKAIKNLDDATALLKELEKMKGAKK